MSARQPISRRQPARQRVEAGGATWSEWKQIGAREHRIKQDARQISKRRFHLSTVAALCNSFLIGLLLSGCSTTTLPPPIQQPSGSRVFKIPGREFPAQIRIERSGMTCRTATKAARATLKRMGYDVQSVVPPTPERTGEIRALRHTGWYTGDGGDSYGVAVRLHCNDHGSVLEAASEEPLSGRLAFKRDFEKELNVVLSRRVNRPRVEARQQKAGLRVSIQPLGGKAAAEQMGSSPGVSGLTPISIRIVNDSPRSYRFTAQRVRLLSEEGKSARPLTKAGVESRLTPAWKDRVTETWLADGTVLPGTTVEGYLYVPAAAYRRAKISLTESESEEAEGFSVEF